MSSTSRRRVRGIEEKKTFHFLWPYRVYVCDLQIVAAAAASGSAWYGEQMPFIHSHEKNLCFPRCQFPFHSRKKYFFLLLYGLLCVSINNRLQWQKDSSRLQSVQMNKVQSIMWIYIWMYLYAFRLFFLSQKLFNIFSPFLFLSLCDRRQCMRAWTENKNKSNEWMRTKRIHSQCRQNFSTIFIFYWNFFLEHVGFDERRGEKKIKCLFLGKYVCRVVCSDWIESNYKQPRWFTCMQSALI